MIPAIATTYAGTRFRSRLEAKWAKFFDLCGWRWEYELPEQGGWIPDFLLIGATHAIKVEVKPIAWCGDEDAVLRQVNTATELGKVRAYVWQTTPDHIRDNSECEDVLVVGAYPHRVRRPEQHDGHTMLGVFISEAWHVHPDLALLARGYPPFKLDFRADVGSYGYRMGGQHEGGSHIRPCEADTVDALWREAGNAVQWRPT